MTCAAVGPGTGSVLPPGCLGRSGKSYLALLFAANVALAGTPPFQQIECSKSSPPVLSGGWEALSPLDTSLAFPLPSPAGLH